MAIVTSTYRPLSAVKMYQDISNEDLIQHIWDRYWDQEDNPPDCRVMDEDLYLHALEVVELVKGKEVNPFHIGLLQEVVRWFEGLKEIFFDRELFAEIYPLDEDGERYREPKEYIWEFPA